ncbi:hypothetical protein MSUIS_06030 [Mycoplasma suis KI3806]|uniref:Uncharacterized protein n=1 Tax=Mycoplasma suis (strain KI_3806) TaxID=708248 RepID=F0V215_MYCS3|nr:hypothetical protein [Mycoplasma suis]CBZ40696.1 hypothetical protein MSUIS_06030 [Mycoplasma suis KI3806]
MIGLKGVLTSLAIGIISSGLAVGGFELNNRLNGEKLSELAKNSEFTWEYLFKNGKKQECGTLSRENREEGAKILEKCDTPWTKEISERNKDEKIIGLWITGEKQQVNEMLKTWKTQQNDLENKEVNDNLDLDNGFSSLKKKCKVSEERNRVEISCSFSKEKTT